MSLAEQRSAQRIIAELFADSAPTQVANWRLEGHRRTHSSPGKPVPRRPDVAPEIRAQKAHANGGVAALDLARVSCAPLHPIQHDPVRIATPASPSLQPAIISPTISPIPPLLPTPALPDVRAIKPAMTLSRSTSRHPIADVIDAGNYDTPPPKHQHSQAEGKGKARGEGGGSGGRVQKTRRNLIGPIVRIASKESLSKLSRRATNLFSPTSATAFLRPAPMTPTPTWSPQLYAPSSSRQPSPSPYQSTAIRDLGEAELVEIPRFKKRELNLAIVRGSGPWRAAWYALWVLWVLNGMMALFFDINVMYLIIQCVVHPSFGSDSSKGWTFAACAYAICWTLSALGVWLGWEVGYEYWRRWRLPRPAIEPLYFSLPATVHLALASLDHFVFLAFIRLSPLDTPHALDIVPETCYALVQLAPSLAPLLPRAAVAVILLITFNSPSQPVQTPFGATDQARLRDDHFFRASGDLTLYARTVMYVFVSFIGLRLVLVVAGGIGLWSFSRRPLGGVIGHRFDRKEPTTPRRARSSLPAHDPSTRSTPRKTWQAAENAFDWEWKERTRARIQDAFELCMVRKSNFRASDPMWSARSTSALAVRATVSPLQSSEATPLLTQQTATAPPSAHPHEASALLRRPASQSGAPMATPPVSRGIAANTDASNSTQDVFYTPASESPSNLAEFGLRRRSHESEESLADDSAALLSDESRHSRENSSSNRSQSSLRQQSGVTGRALARARSTSVSLLRESIGKSLMNRARSGTLRSSDSHYTEIDNADQAFPRRRSRLGAREDDVVGGSEIRVVTM